jgi:hypothetical protein
MTKQNNQWNNAKKKILSILNEDLPEEVARQRIEALVKKLPFGMNIKEHVFSFNACGYPYWATHKTIRSDSFMLREILDLDMDPETFETDYRCPCCRQFAAHKT